MPKSARKKSHLPSMSVMPARPYRMPEKNGSSVKTTQGSNLIAPNTSIGQHFLKNPAVVNSIIQKASVKVNAAF